MGTRITTAAAVALALVALTGCTQQPTSASQGAVKAACEKKVGPSVVAWWRDQYDETPWKVIDTHSLGIEKGSESTADATVFYVSGESSVQREETGNMAEAVRWSCFAQYTADDPQTVSASIREIRPR
ncbi:hypothetical protein HUN58_14745 [Curtobacterium sp. Csp1]|uniref:hypothetical protein n=1 Tax=Curtobacterium sp. Csp1 TaxID=2495429 RepID=UPI001599E62E|nr:hypothetical protein [Curtobacterium sp. Csp1]QKS21012.1 hypothetical protein HUN58_14745 [Curtobacterium sp. Csp1]